MTSEATHYRRLEAMYHAAPINQLYSVKMTVGRGCATIETEVDPRFFHAAGALHGSALQTFIETNEPWW